MRRLSAFLLLSLASCLIADRDNICDPAGSHFDLVACRTECSKVQCPSGSGHVATAEAGCACVACADLRCGADEYNSGCACEPLNGTVQCSGGNCTVSCNTGFDSCDDDAMNGCEAALSSDAAHCGRCDNDCGAAECVSGKCGPVELLHQGGFSRVAANDQLVVYAEGASIKRLPLAGGTPIAYPPLGSITSVHRIEVDSTVVFGCSRASDPLTNELTTLFAGPVDGSAGMTAFFSEPHVACGQDMFVTPTDFYTSIFIQGGNPPLPATSRIELWRIDRATKNHTIVAPLGFCGPDAIAVDDTDVYYDDCGPLRRLPKGSSTPITINDIAHADAIVVDAEHVYWTSAWTIAPNMIGIYRANRDGTGLTQISAEAAEDLYVDDTHLYWADRRLHRIPKSGGDAETLGPEAPTPFPWKLRGTRDALVLVGPDAEIRTRRNVWRVPK